MPNITESLNTELSNLYDAAMESLFKGNYDKTTADLKAAKEKMAEAEITTFTPETERCVNPSAWIAIESSLEMGLGNYQRATELALQALNAREEVLQGDKTHHDYVSIRFLLIQIKMGEENYTEASRYLNEIADYFKNIPENPTRTFSSMYLFYLTSNAVCQNKLEKDNKLFKANIGIALDYHNKFFSNPTPNLALIQMLDCVANAELDAYDQTTRRYKLKFHEEAFQAVNDLMNRTLGEGINLTKIQLRMHYAQMYVHFKAYHFANKLLTEAKNMLEQMLPKQINHGYLIKINLEFTKNLVAMGIPEVAVKYLKRATDYLKNNPNASLQKLADDIGSTFKAAPANVLVGHSINAPRTTTIAQTPESEKIIDPRSRPGYP